MVSSGKCGAFDFLGEVHLNRAACRLVQMDPLVKQNQSNFEFFENQILIITKLSSLLSYALRMPIKVTYQTGCNLAPYT